MKNFQIQISYAQFCPILRLTEDSVYAETFQ